MARNDREPFTNWMALLPTSLREDMLACARPRRFPAGALVYSSADVPDSLHLIQSGSAYWTISYKTGESLLLRISREGDMFGEVVLSDAAPAPIHVTARSDLCTAAIPRSDFLRLSRAHPEYNEALCKGLARRLRGTLRIVEEIALLPLPERTRARLARLAQEADPEAAGRTHVRVDITQTELSSMLAASRPATNKVLSALEQNGEIVVRFRSLDVSPELVKAVRENR